jgi:hypothetical protein
MTVLGSNKSAAVSVSAPDTVEDQAGPLLRARIADADTKGIPVIVLLAEPNSRITLLSSLASATIAVGSPVTSPDWHLHPVTKPRPPDDNREYFERHEVRLS